MNRPLLCATITAPTTAELRRGRDAATEDADLIELRLDTVRDPDVAGALAGRRKPVILTCRPVWEGGQFSGSEEERRRLLSEALQHGAEYVDIELRAGFDDIIALTSGRRIVVSSHDFEGVPRDLADRARAMRATGAEVMKIAVKTERLSDCLPLLDLAAASGSEGSRSVFIGMGAAGLITRVLPGRFGSAWTYAGNVSAVGQTTVRTLLDRYRFRSIGETTALYGLTGTPIAHSVSPAMHNAALEHEGIDAVYLPFPAHDPDDFMQFARAFGLRGASVTIPFKVALLDHVDAVDEISARIGAINTVQHRDGRWLGRNTDAVGFLQPLIARGVALAGRRASILGTGGSARAVAVALASKGASVTVHGRDVEKASAVAATVSGMVGEFPPARGSWDLLVNCTPTGMHPNIEASPVAVDRLTGGVVYDLVYNPVVTRLLSEAAAAGCQTIGGLDMLVAQAVEQFAWWTGVAPSASVMRAAALAALSEFSIHENHVV